MIRLRRGLERLSTLAALIGGGFLLVAVLVTTASVIRGIFGKPILGDSEIVEMCLGVAVALFLPYGEMKGSHVIVDVFTVRMPERGLVWLDAFMRGIVALVAAVLALSLLDGTMAQWERERATMFLELPYWWGYAGASVGMVLWAISAFFVAFEHARFQQHPRKAS
ncbi:MAG: TRAP transporter small permease [Alphaproteobacteria bacterium]